jgi:hypothetical protein
MVDEADKISPFRLPRAHYSVISVVPVGVDIFGANELKSVDMTQINNSGTDK